MQHNVLYEDRDIEVYLLDNEDMDDFMVDAVDKVQKRSHSNKRHAEKDKGGEQEVLLDEAAELDGYMQFGLCDQYDLGGSAWTL
jgi:hypothetical protein